MDAVGGWVLTFLVNSLWQVAVVVSATALADLGLRRTRARYRHMLWLTALVAAVVSPVASTKGLKNHVTPVNAAVQVPNQTGLQLPGQRSLSVVIRMSARRAQPSFAKTTLALLAGVHCGIRVSPWVSRTILIAYLSFLILALARLVLAWTRTRAIRHAAFATPLPDHLTSSLERCRRAMAGGREPGQAQNHGPNPSVLWSSQIAGPVTVGALRASIILPVSFLDDDAREDLEAALAHEMAHVCRRDYLWNLIFELVLIPIAFHPLTRLVKRRLSETRELACDELASRLLEPPRYARSLVRIANQISRRAAAAPKVDYTLGVFDANILEERVMTLLKPRASGRLAQLSVLVAAIAIVSSFLLAARYSLGVDQVSKSGVPATSDSRTPNVSKVGTNSLSGIVVDSSGARVIKATVWLVNRDSGGRQQTGTDETGDFTFKNLAPGRYTLGVASAGMGGSFRMFTLKAEGKAPFFPFVLQPGAVAESAVVTAKLPPGLPAKASTSAGPRSILIGGSVEGAKLIENLPQPVYPESAQSRGIQGRVLLQTTISAEGVPTNLKVLSSPSEDLSKAAQDAVRQWKYHSTLLNGQPIAVLTTIAVDFRLEE